MSDIVEDYKFSKSNFWDAKEDLCENLNYSSSNSFPFVENKSKTANFMCKNNEACLVLTVPPENRFRYRYDTEMSGTHGSLQGIRTGREKSVPTVQLFNFSEEALIRVTLVTCQEKDEPYPHPHSLFVKEKLYQKKVYENWDKKSLTKTGHYSGPHYIRLGTKKNDYTARFEGMCIINSKKENFHASVSEKIRMRLQEQKYGTYKNLMLRRDESDELADKVDKAVSAIDVDFVSLCFEAFREEAGKLHLICPPIYSEPIGNAKSAKTGKLKISRINKCSGSCKGGDEIWMLVEKINKKGLIVRFWEECNGKLIWQSCLEGDDIILHHQYAIIFKTPAYREVNTMSEVEVLMRLERTTQPNQPCDFSEPITFVYEPLKCKLSKEEHLYRKESILTPLEQFHIKRPRTDSSTLSLFNHRTSCNGNELEFGCMNYESSEESYIEQILFNEKESIEFDQAWAKFNVEEFLQFLSTDDIDMPFQKDGVSLNGKHRRDFLYKLYLLYSKLDESDLKKLTEDVSKFRVSKKEMQPNNMNVEKEQVKDAASTLLSLRSRALTNSSVPSGSHKIEGNKKLCSPLSHSKAEKLNSILKSNDTCSEADFDVPSSIHTSVIMNNAPKSRTLKESDDHREMEGKPRFLVNVEDKKSRDQHIINSDLIRSSKGSIPSLVSKKEKSEQINCKNIKKEIEVPYNCIDIDKLDAICEILNKSGAWKNLAELWDCGHAISGAKLSLNPTKCIFEYAEKVHGGLEPEVLRYLLGAVSEKGALEILDDILTH